MTLLQQILTVAVVVLGTMTTRFLPFLLFPEGRKPPAFIRYLGTVLPSAVDWPFGGLLPEGRGLHFLARPAGDHCHPGRWPAVSVEKERLSQHRRGNRLLHDPGADPFFLIHSASRAPYKRKNEALPTQGSRLVFYSVTSSSSTWGRADHTSAAVRRW